MMHMICKISKFLDTLDDIIFSYFMASLYQYKSCSITKSCKINSNYELSMTPLRTIFFTLAFTLFDDKPICEPILLYEVLQSLAKVGRIVRSFLSSIILFSIRRHTSLLQLRVIKVFDIGSFASPKDKYL